MQSNSQHTLYPKHFGFVHEKTAGSRSKNSATNQKRAYGVGTELVRTGYACIQPGILMGHTHIVRSVYGVGTDCRGWG